MDARRRHRGSFMASNATIARTALFVIVFSIAAWAVLSRLGLGDARAAKLARRRLTVRIFNVAMGVLLAATALWLTKLGR
jgi:threonine/homoserine/homoserine lactone efflux protein